MNLKLPACAFALIAPISFTGCFSAAVQMGEGWGDGAGGGHSSIAVKGAAAAADVATLPIQALAVGVINSMPHQVSPGERDANYVKEIHKNPEIIFSSKLHLVGWEQGLRAVTTSLRDPTTPFTEEQLLRLYKEMNDGKSVVLQNPRCPIALRQEVWNTITTKDVFRYEDELLMEALLDNPTAPREWLEIVSKNRPRYPTSSGRARELLKLRDQAQRSKEPNQLPQPPRPTGG